MTPEQFQTQTGVDGDTLARLKTYAHLLEKWQGAINLVGPDTMPDMWSRHFLDSAQLAQHIGPHDVVADLGSGAGFPGMVLAIMGKKVHLLESDERKSTFLSTVNRECAAMATVHTGRIEKTKPIGANVVVARALAPLEKLLDLALPHRISTGKCLFLKGKSWDEELTAAKKRWNMRTNTWPSITDSNAAVIEINEISPL
ncbi:MAG: 16S rRNA (guanine(527)-N(7))-methyltransferase RsmG [Rhodospirillaceae bacterium]|nr:16S rRNA (guanine(527)-N(7))-methyltransferase RsmG [Rhodospirillaceae bacterium]MCK5546843.1 16S rRNA (guanine(527)-N(7))-methyltransferase RsmG [Rhodospirillaceae bacterium]